MGKLQFNLEEYERLKHRKQILEERIKNDKPGHEKDTAKRLLEKVSIKLEEYEKTHDIPVSAQDTLESNFSTSSKSNYSTSSSKTYQDFETDPYFNDFINYVKDMYKHARNHFSHVEWETHINEEKDEDKFYYEDTRSEDELFKDLGVLYLIFGSTYQTYLNYHIYKVRLLKQIDRREIAFMRVKANVYEDDILICKEINIGFWPFRFGDDRVGDMEWSTDSPGKFKKYNNGCQSYLNKILDEMKDLWNSYFDEATNTPLLGRSITGYIEDTSDNNISISMTREQRLEVIRKVEKEIKSKQYSTRFRPVFCNIRTIKKFNTLEDFLENSGVVYRVTQDCVLIWNVHNKTFMKLIDYEEKGKFDVVLSLLPNYPFF